MTEGGPGTEGTPTDPGTTGWCWGAGRVPHVADDVAVRLGRAALCGACWARWQAGRDEGSDDEGT